MDADVTLRPGTPGEQAEISHAIHDDVAQPFGLPVPDDGVRHAPRVIRTARSAAEEPPTLTLRLARELPL
jgi:hypothetical protein